MNDTYDKGLIAAALLLYIKQSFDTDDHDKLLKILEIIGIRNVALKWFCSYFINGAQAVQNTNATSERRILPCGVPQGSIL